MILINIITVVLLLEVCVCGPGVESVDCVRASELCNQDGLCSSRYRIMRQCVSGGGAERSAMLASLECRRALTVLNDSPLRRCRCRRGMKKELQCLQNYWSFHMGLGDDEEFYETSPYEPIGSSEEFRHASIISDPSWPRLGSCSEGRPCNPCVDAAKACNLNDTCKRLRSAYNAVCSKATPPQTAPANQEPCSRKRCQKALRLFFERVSPDLSFPLLFCSCSDAACGERRRRTIVPSCSHQDTLTPSCRDLRHTCRADALCRSRLADFYSHCGSWSDAGCPAEKFHGCLVSYVGLIGSDVTPNYSDSNPNNITLSVWCSCSDHDRECRNFQRDFTHNACLKNAIQSFGYGSEGRTLSTEPPPPSEATPPTRWTPAVCSQRVPTCRTDDQSVTTSRVTRPSRSTAPWTLRTLQDPRAPVDQQVH